MRMTWIYMPHLRQVVAESDRAHEGCLPAEAVLFVLPMAVVLVAMTVLAVPVSAVLVPMAVVMMAMLPCPMLVVAWLALAIHLLDSLCVHLHIMILY